MQNRDINVIGILVIITYFLIVAWFKNTELVQNLGGMPLVDCVVSLIENGNNTEVMSTLVTDFAQVILTIFVVVFTMNVIPNIPGRGLWRIITVLGAYVIIYLLALSLVRTIIFSGRINEILRVFIAIFTSVVAGLFALVSVPLRGVIAASSINTYLRDYLLDSRIVHWLADSFFVATVILFLTVAIQMTVGINNFFDYYFKQLPFQLIGIGIMIGLMVYMVRGGRS